MTQTFICTAVSDIKEIGNSTFVFNAAYNPPQKDADPIYIGCILFKDIAAVHKNIIKFLIKGKRLIISGNILKLETYENKLGETKAKINLKVYSINFLPSSQDREKDRV